MISNPPLIVDVIGMTEFIGVPPNLWPDNIHDIGKKHQDEGTGIERIIECAARTCYDSYGKGRSSAEHHEHILDVRHGSVTEHATINFYIANVSRGLTHELVRHRAGVAISQRSTRYVNEAESDWIHHPLLIQLMEERYDQRLEIEIDSLIDQARAIYMKVADRIEIHLIEKGVTKLTARKQARGAARGYLGNALSTSLVWTANIRELRFCMEQRHSEHADAEIRLMFHPIYEAAARHAPAYFGDYVFSECADGIGSHANTPNKKI